MDKLFPFLCGCYVISKIIDVLAYIYNKYTQKDISLQDADNIFHHLDGEVFNYLDVNERDELIKYMDYIMDK